MAIPELEEGYKLTVGAKQTRLAIERGAAVKVFVAQDAEERVVEPILRLCSRLGLPVIEGPSMRELGKACGIQVGASSAAMVRK